uniref:Uncharacterized protein n=1 Tax=Cacopsylla melanoneura TaxID=428564 RepID=A0A8D8YI17_9HEMI
MSLEWKRSSLWKWFRTVQIQHVDITKHNYLLRPPSRHPLLIARVKSTIHPISMNLLILIKPPITPTYPVSSQIQLLPTHHSRPEVMLPTKSQVLLIFLHCYLHHN